jgi:hypothetical protein
LRRLVIAGLALPGLLVIGAEPGLLALERGLARPAAPAAHRQENPAARSFFGTGEVGQPERLCDELLAAPPPGTRTTRWPWPDVLRHLHEARAPSETRDELWAATVAVRRELESRVEASSQPLSPAGLLALGVAAAGGDLGLGVLACHDWLKDLTYTGRAITPRLLPARHGRLASRLLAWRSQPSQDKLGPLYHVFAALSAGVLTGDARFAWLAVNGESTLRVVHWGGDRPDPEKALADRCGARAAERLLAR